MACNGLHPRVAVIAIISNENGQVLAGRRLGPLGTGTPRTLILTLFLPLRNFKYLATGRMLLGVRNASL